REIAGRLVAPGTVERMLANRHQLDMGKAHVENVAGEVPGDLRIAWEATRIVAEPAPGPQVQLIDRHRRAQRVGRGTPAHPFAVAPAIVERPDARSRSRRLFAIERDRIAFFERLSIRCRDPVFVVGAGSRSGDRPLPDARTV